MPGHHRLCLNSGKKNFWFRFIIYLIIIIFYGWYNLTTFDLYLIQRNPLIYFRINWFNIVSLVLLLAIFYKVSIKK